MNYMKKKYLIKFILSMIAVSILFMLILNNSSMYKTTVAKVTDVTDRDNNQLLELRIENGHNKGKVIHLKNKYDKSRTYDEKYYRNDYVFLNDDYSGITGVKRDYWVAGVFLLLIAALITIGGRQGVFTSICIIGNIALFGIVIFMNIHGNDILYMTILSVLIFTFFVLLVTDGFNKHMLLSYASTLLTTLLLSLCIMLLIWRSDIDYDFLHFLPEPFTVTDARHFFLAQVIIGCLGAVIDVSVTVTAAATELIERTRNLKFKGLLQSLHEIADDITGTMISVVLLTNIASTLPIFLISMSNEISFRTVINHDAYFYIARSFSGMLSIVVAILVSIFVTSLVARKELKHD